MNNVFENEVPRVVVDGESASRLHNTPDSWNRPMFDRRVHVLTCACVRRQRTDDEWHLLRGRGGQGHITNQT